MEFDGDLSLREGRAGTTAGFDRPEKHSALTESMQKQLHEAVRAVRYDEEARVLIFSGAGSTVCAGDDVVEFPVLWADRWI